MRDEHRVGAAGDHQAHVLPGSGRGPDHQVAGLRRVLRDLAQVAEHRAGERRLARVEGAGRVRVRRAGPRVAERGEAGAVGRERHRCALAELREPDVAVLRVGDLGAVLAAPHRPLDDPLPDRLLRAGLLHPLRPPLLERRRQRLLAGEERLQLRAEGAVARVGRVAELPLRPLHRAGGQLAVVAVRLARVERAERVLRQQLLRLEHVRPGHVRVGELQHARSRLHHDLAVRGGQPLQQHGRAALLRDRGRREAPVGDVLPARVVVREAPEVRRRHVRVVVAVAEAVVALELEERPRHAPVLPLGEPLVAQRVDRALLPGERRLAGLRPAGGDVRGAGGQRVAVVQVAREVPARLQRVDDPDHVPRDPERLADLLVAGPRGRDPRDELVDRGPAVRSDEARLVEQLVVAALGVGQRGHRQSPVPVVAAGSP